MRGAVRLVDLVLVTPGRMIHEHPVFSPVGKTIACYGGTYGRLQIYLVGIDGTGERPPTCAMGNHTRPDFSPDGRHVSFRRQRTNEAPWSIFRVRRTIRPSAPSSSPTRRRASSTRAGRSLAWFSDAGTPGCFLRFRAPLRADGIGGPIDGRRRLALRGAREGARVGDLTSGTHEDKHPSPCVPVRGPTSICLASKKHEIDVPEHTNVHFDIVRGTLEGARVRR